MTVRYWRNRDGVVLTREIVVAPDGYEIETPVPAGFIEIPAETGAQAIKAIEAKAMESKARQITDVVKRAAADFKTLANSGMPPEMAQRLSGVNPNALQGGLGGVLDKISDTWLADKLSGLLELFRRQGKGAK